MPQPEIVIPAAAFTAAAFAAATPIDTTAVVLGVLQTVTSVVVPIGMLVVPWWIVRSDARRKAEQEARDAAQRAAQEKRDNDLKADQAMRDAKTAAALVDADKKRDVEAAERLRLQSAIAEGVDTMKSEVHETAEVAALIHRLTDGTMSEQKAINRALQDQNTMLEKKLSSLEAAMAAGFTGRGAAPAPERPERQPAGTETDPLKVTLAGQTRPVETTDVTPRKR